MTLIKVCGTCKEQLSPDSFYKSNGTKDGLMYECKICSNARAKQWQQENKGRHKDSVLKYRYGISSVEINRLLLKQENLCAICGIEFSHSTPYHIDHCHSSGDVRGLLCINCNVGLGQFSDNISTLTNAVFYLQGLDNYVDYTDLTN